MKKLFLVFILSMTLVCFSSLSVVIAEDEIVTQNNEVMTPMQQDFVKLMTAVYGLGDPVNPPINYEKFYKELTVKYASKDFTAFKIVHLKYLFLTGNKNEFVKVLATFRDDFVFKNTVNVDSKEMELHLSLQANKDYSKKDLNDLWKKIDEIDQSVKQMMKRKEYLKLLDTFATGGYPVGDIHSLIGGPYSTFDNKNKWVDFGISGSCGDYSDRHTFFDQKNKTITDFLIRNLKNYLKDDPSVLAKFLYFRSSSSDNDLFKPLNSAKISKTELQNIRETILALQNKTFSAEKIYIYPPIYDSNSYKFDGTLYTLKYTDDNYDCLNAIGMDDSNHRCVFYFRTEFNEENPERFRILQIPQTNYYAIELRNGYGDSRVQIDLMIFKKTKDKWIPVILYHFSPWGGC